MIRRSEFWKNRDYYLMILPAAFIFFLFAYLPMPGVIIAFKNYNFVDGIFGSPFIGLKNFLFYFTSNYALRTTFNTFWINFNYIFFGNLIAVLFAIMLNEVRTGFMKKTYQNLMFLPYFLSVIIVGKFVSILFSSDMGLINQLLSILHVHAVDWYIHPEYWVKILVGTNIWKNTGYTVIIYLAVITGIDQELFESAALDGATRFQRIRYITIPLLVPTIIILVLLAIGRVFFGDFQLIYAVIGDQNGSLLPTTDVIETYVYRSVKTNYEFGMPAAVGLYQSFVGFLLIFGSNFLVKLYNKDYSLF